MSWDNQILCVYIIGMIGVSLGLSISGWGISCLLLDARDKRREAKGKSVYCSLLEYKSAMRDVSNPDSVFITEV